MSAAPGLASERARPEPGGFPDVLRFEAARRVRVTAIIAVYLAVFGGFYVWLGPQLIFGTQMQEILETLPPAMKALLGFESLGSLEGLLASEFYTFGWIVGLGGYVAYSAAGSVAGDVQTDRMDTLLAAPIARDSVLLGKYLALLGPIVGVNVLVPATLYAASVVVGEPLAWADLAVVHVLSVPYLLVWGAVGLLVGVLVPRARVAGRLALGLVFGAWVVESFLVTTDYARAGAVSPTRYFDPPAVLVHGTYDLTGAGLLLASAAALVAASLLWFRRRDV